MRIKWKEDYSSITQRKFGLLVGYAGGLVSAWIIYGVYTSWSMFEAESWLDILSTIGTLGAALAAVYAGRVAIYIAENEREDKKLEMELDKKNKIYIYERVFVGAYAAVHDDLVLMINLLQEKKRNELMKMISGGGFLHLRALLNNVDKLIYFKSNDIDNLVQMIACLELVKESVAQNYASALSALYNRDNMLDGQGSLRASRNKELEEIERLENRMDSLLKKVYVHALSVEWLRKNLPDGERDFKRMFTSGRFEVEPSSGL
ncbi:hypothetical protein JYG33_03160 [Alcaligenes sp. SORT26]|uniref:hypothetical protein n=1 Tax=Alcaligenes sp. SORT26 TaxID=2813780 RepID=UPI001A9EF2BC|nr:hypothetical protein [Alcaligenes sp. SORT26]QTC00481.1 hypothetical protein JYG33_03160 [Alcaligenes sp. SORT26]